MDKRKDARSGAQVLVDCLLAQGVETIFGVPGESYLAVLDVLHDVPQIRLIPNRHESGAGFMAAAWGKLTGRPGIAFVTRGPGASNASIGVHAARQDSTPMILFVGQVPVGMREREAFQEVDYRAMFGGIAKWATEIDSADRVPEMIARAFAVAQSGRPGPVVVALPEDMLTEMTTAAAGPQVRIPRPSPGPKDVEEARAMLRAAERPLIIAGGNGWTAEGKAALRRFAEDNHIPVLVDFRRQELIDNASPAYAGDAGLGKTPAVTALIREADLILALGTQLGEITTDGYTMLGIPRTAQRLIHVFPEDLELNRIYTADLPVHAHPDALMQVLAGERLARAADGEARMARAHAAWAEAIIAPPQPGALDMGEVMRHLDAVLPDDAIMTNGAGNFATWLNKHFPFTGRRRLIAPQAGAMGYGVPAAIAVGVAHPDATVICFSGDGDFQMSIPELGCAMQAGVQPVILVINNRSYGTIRMHQEQQYPGRVSFTEIENPDFAAIARAYGMHGEEVRATADFPDAFARALASPTGAVLDLIIDTESLTPRRTLSAIRAAALEEQTNG